MNHISVDNVPLEVLEILRKLEHHGYKAHLVGGCIRDLLLGELPSDWDITTSAKPNEVEQIFEKTVPTGIEHGTVTVIIGRNHYEVTTYRIDGDYLDNRRPSEVVFSDRIEEDLARRDFTVNSISVDANGIITDPFGGLEDLEEKIIRCVGDPDMRFKEDALRIVRGVRFASVLGFDIEEKTLIAIEKHMYLLDNISIERIRDEIDKIIVKNPYGLMVLKNLGGFDVIYPRLNMINESLIDIMDDLFFGGEIVEGEIEGDALSDLDRSIAILAEFICDSVEEVEKLLRFFKYDNKKVKISREYFKIKSFFLKLCEKNKDIEDREVRVFVKRMLKSFNKEAVLVFLSVYSEYIGIYKDIIKKNEPYSLRDLEINGSDLKDLGFDGKEIGETLDGILEDVIKSPYKNERKRLLNKIISDNGITRK